MDWPIAGKSRIVTLFVLAIIIGESLLQCGVILKAYRG